MKLKITPKHLMRGLIYLLGIFVTGLGVNVLLRGALGAGAWDTVIYNLRSFLNGVLQWNVTLGTVSFMIYAIVLAFVIIYNKKLKFLFVLIPIFGISLAIDFWDIVIFGNFYPTILWVRLALFVIGIFTLTLGLSLIIVTKYPAMVFDELTLMMMKIFKSNSFFKTRIFIELFAIVLASIFGFLAQIGFGAVNVGSFILALVIGPMIEFQLRWLNKCTKSLFISTN